MSWPNPNEYVEAIQNPKQNFIDSELQTSRVITNKLGLPRTISGNFATVFEVESGGQKRAVRCFLREVTNQQERYLAISRHLKKYNLKCMVGFEFLQQGIKVKGKWYPILKMDWTSGQRLDAYIEANLTNPQKLQALTARWASVCQSLKQSNIAHGDLQHGNILIDVNGEIKIIDYDGLYITETINLPSNEIGHRHYQHPTRISNDDISTNNYLNIDNFSIQVISSSLSAISADYTLWKTTKAGEENLLFKDSDFKNPGQSSTFKLLERHGDERVRNLAQVMYQIVRYRSYLDIPYLGSVASSQLGKEWLRDHLITSNSLQDNPIQINTTSWLTDHIQEDPETFIEFSSEFVISEKKLIERDFQNSPLRWFRPIFRRILLHHIAERFETHAVVIEKRRIEKTFIDLEQQRLQIGIRLKLLERKLEEIEQNLHLETRKLEAQKRRLSDEITSLEKKQADEIQQLNESHFEDYYNNKLSNYVITPNRISGIGPRRVEVLNSVGIYSAADIIPVNMAKAHRALSVVKGSSPTREWHELERWRSEIKNSIPRPFPKFTNPIELKKITDKYTYQLNEKKLQRNQVQQQLDQINVAPITLKQMQQINEDITRTRQEIHVIDQRVKRIRKAVERYKKITLENLVELIIM